MAKTLAALNPYDQGLIQAVKKKFETVAQSIGAFRSRKISLEQTFSDTYLLPYIYRKTTWFPGYFFKENETKQTLAKLYRDIIKSIPKIYKEMNLYDMEEFLGLTGNRYGFMLRPNFVVKMFYAFTTPEFHTFLESKCQLEGTLGATQLLIALKSYEKKTGELPERLELLCPDHLKTVPSDPFDGKPFRYSREKATIYSVGKDLKDSQGSMEIPAGEIYGRNYPKTWVAEDAVFNINL